MLSPALGNARVLSCRPQLDRLRRVTAFARLSHLDLTTIARRSTVRRFSAGAVVVGQHERVPGFIIVCQGSAKIALFGENGRELVLGTLASTETFGETALIEDTPSSTSLVAVDDLVVIIVEPQAFMSVLARDPVMAMSLLRKVSAHARRAEQLIGGLGLHDVSARLEQTLVALAEEQGEPCDDGIFLRARPTQQDLANMVGTCRETVSRALSSMARRGLVVPRGRSLLLRRAFVERAKAAAA